MRKLSWFLFAVVFAAKPLFALDKEKLTKHLRAMLNTDTRTQITVGDPAPSNFAGLLAVPVNINRNDFVVYMTTDEKQYFWGNLNDLSVNPDQDRLSKLKTT